MDERIGLVFSWDPRGRNWVKERGPADAAPPPADPIDNETVQTYFLDTQTGRWQSTILGMQGRQISVALGSRYRAAMVVGLAILPSAKPRKAVAPDNKRKGVPLMAAIATIVVVIGAGAFVAQAMRPADVDTAIPTVAPLVSAPVVVVSNEPVATAQPTVEATAPAATVPGATQKPAPTAPPRTAAPTPPPVDQSVVYSNRLTNGTTVTYAGPNGVTQGAVLSGTLSVRLAGGSGGTEPITVNVGALGSYQSVTLSPDGSGNFRLALRVTGPKGTFPISFSLGKNGELRILGNITIH